MYINLTADELNVIIDALLKTKTLEEGVSLFCKKNGWEKKRLIKNLRSQMENPVEKLSVAVEVRGGLVQAAYANGDIFVDVYDLDVSDFPDPGEEEEAEQREAELEELVSSPGWHMAY